MTISRFAAIARCAAIGAVLLGVAGTATVASAQQAFVSTRTSLRAGPDYGYPQVAWLGGGRTVYINGCVRGYHWCDVTSGPFRGWANARHLQYFYGGQRLMVYGNGVRFGLPMVGFALGSYWDSYYRGQPWYGRRDHWNGWRPGTPAPRFDGPVMHQPRVMAPPPQAAFAPHPQYRQSPPPAVVHQQPMRVAQPQPQPHQQHYAQPRGMGPQHVGERHQPSPR